MSAGVEGLVSALTDQCPARFRRWVACVGPFIASVLIAGCATGSRDADPSAGLIERMAAADIVLLGELHDQPGHHRVRVQWLEALAEKRPITIVMEQLDHRGQPQLDAERARLVESETLSARARRVVQAAGFDFEGWNWAFYRPVVELAIDRAVPLRAGNLSREEAMNIARGQAHRLSAKPPSGWGPAQETLLRASITEGHCGLLPDSMIVPMVNAQRARDAQIAEVALAAQASGRLPVILAGNAHVRRDYGIPLHLSAAAPGLKVLSVGLLEQGQPGSPQAYDAVWSVPPIKRQDPCDALRKRFAPRPDIGRGMPVR